MLPELLSAAKAMGETASALDVRAISEVAGKSGASAEKLGRNLAEGKSVDAFKAIEANADASYMVDVPGPFKQFYKDGQLDMQSIWTQEINEQKHFSNLIDAADHTRGIPRSFLTNQEQKAFAQEIPIGEQRHFIAESERLSKGKPNCYGAAMGMDKNPITGATWKEMPQPGVLSGRNMDFSNDYMRILYQHPEKTSELRDCILKYVRGDCEAMGKDLIELKDMNDQAPKGYRRVFLSYAPFSGDYHWFYETPFGDWYHKPGTSPLRCFDCSGHRITNPALCNRGEYTTDMGFFAIKEGEKAYGQKISA